MVATKLDFSAGIYFKVWISLYARMGLIYQEGVGFERNLALSLYATQLVLNWLWSPIFFIN